MLIDTKAKFLELWQAGAFGNKLRSWLTFTDWAVSGYNGLTNIRSRRADSSKTRYGIPEDQMASVMQELIADKAMTLDEMYFIEAAPDHCLIIQGEYQSGYLMYSSEKTRMKKVRSWEHSEGVRSNLLLHEAMSPDSYDDFQLLRELYPGHIIEFSCYEQLLGDCFGRNTIIWEVRNY